jgi:hypothetical protein
MRDRKKIVAALLAAGLLSMGAVRAEDFCDTSAIMAKAVDRDAAEKRVREKCKAGDIIFVDAGLLIPRLCDLRQPVVRCGATCPGGDQAHFCFLAPPHKVY